jgi:hypothetical protein
MHKVRRRERSLLWAVLTDVQFWIPAVVLALGIGLLVFIHGS